MIDALPWIGVAALGALGALGRFTVDGAVSARWPSDFPSGTLVVNLSGGFVLGLLVGLGLLGGYTTFSTWMVETERLGEAGEWRLMWSNLLGPMLIGLAATGLGWILGGAIS